MTSDPRHIPSISYDAPPLVEVAISVQFDPPKGLNLAHLGAYWATQKIALPLVRVVQSIATTHEAFGDQGQWLPPSLQLALTNEPDGRLQMTSSDDQWMCQVQRDRLVINWRKRNEQYPRFGATWQRFKAAWKAWRSFLMDEGLDPPNPRYWELTYVNRIPKSGLWESPSDWPKLFPGLWGGATVTLDRADLRGIHGQWVWESTDPAARLYVEPKPGRSMDQPPEDLLLLNLVAKGPVARPTAGKLAKQGAELESITVGIDRGHALIVTTFDRIASEAAKRAWGRHGNTD